MRFTNLAHSGIEDTINCFREFLSLHGSKIMVRFKLDMKFQYSF